MGVAMRRYPNPNPILTGRDIKVDPPTTQAPTPQTSDIKLPPGGLER